MSEQSWDPLGLMSRVEAYLRLSEQANALCESCLVRRPEDVMSDIASALADGVDEPHSTISHSPGVESLDVIIAMLSRFIDIKTGHSDG